MNLEKAIRMCRAAETVKTQAKELFSESCNVDAVKRDAHRAFKKRSGPNAKNETKPVQRDEQGKKCGRCGTQHPPTRCPAYKVKYVTTAIKRTIMHEIVTIKQSIAKSIQWMRVTQRKSMWM